jgi:hypothetical protein
MRGGYVFRKHRRHRGDGGCGRSSNEPMTASALQAPLEPGRRKSLWLTAIAAALVLGVGLLLIQRMPAAETIQSGNTKLNASGTHALVLYDLRPAPVMQYEGAPATGLRVSVSTGRISNATRKTLFDLGAQVPNVRGASLDWQGRAPANGRISVKLGNQRQSPDAGLMLQAARDGRPAELTIRAVQTVLTAQIDIVSQGSEAAPAPSLIFGDVAFSNPALAFAPIQIEIPPGESMKLTFDNDQALGDSKFRLGDPAAAATGLPVGRAEVGQLGGSGAYPRLQGVDQGVCAARSGKLLFTHSYPRPGECHLAADAKSDRLRATEIAVEPRQVGLTLKGSGFVLADDRARPAALLPTLVANPLVAALIAVLVYAIGRPLWRLWTGRGM